MLQRLRLSRQNRQASAMAAENPAVDNKVGLDGRVNLDMRGASLGELGLASRRDPGCRDLRTRSSDEKLSELRGPDPHRLVRGGHPVTRSTKPRSPWR